MTAQMIDAASGAIDFDRGVVSARLVLRAFLESPLARGATLEVDNGKHRTYELARPLELDGRSVAASLSFVGETLAEISVELVDDRFGASWDDWSAAKELARKAAHTKWLRGCLGGAGPRWELPWGVVESTYDPKGGGSSIEISFAKRAR